jgi:soluble lytic murein transglycosylase-like protein
VDFEKGIACVQILLKSTDDPKRDMVFSHLRQGVGNLILREAEDPLEMFKIRRSETYPLEQRNGGGTELPAGKEIRIHLVRPSDSLWKIARQIGMETKALAKLNELDPEEVLRVGHPLKVVAFASHDLTLDPTPQNQAKDPLLLDQIRMADGRPVSHWLVHDFATEALENQPPRVEKVVGADGIERLAVTAEFMLVSNHLEVRARKYYPLVIRQAEKHKLEPALIMAIIHTESLFNPRARSGIPAYGLMQLVPKGGALEAYRMAHGKKQRLTPEYLYVPKNNIELGSAFLSILKNRYMGEINDPTSRTYCAVAAYNAGASNVGNAFIPIKSIKQATPKINRMDPPDVYRRLVDALPLEESRIYVREVLKRVELYRDWQ